MIKAIISILVICMTIITALGQDKVNPKMYQGLTWSGDGQYLSFSIMEMLNTTPRSFRSDVYTMRTDGSELKKITGEAANEFDPSWAKSGERIFFSAMANGSKMGNIFSINLDGTGLKQVTALAKRSAAPSVSPDGTKIVFNFHVVDRKPQIYVMNTDGTGLKALTEDNNLAFYNPLWSPDGKKIVYYVEKGDGKDQIWTMNSDGTGQKLLTNNIGHNFYPSWSADGKRIIFCSDRDGEKPVIYSMNADGTNIERLLEMKSSYAKFSPDGKKIAFVAGAFPSNNIFIADADGKNAKKIL